MSAENVPRPTWIPDACALPAARQPVRLVEFDDLFATAAPHPQRINPQRLRLTLPGPAGLASTVRDLVDREGQCCSFFTFTITTPASGHVVLDIEVPATQVDVLDALARRAASVRIGT